MFRYVFLLPRSGNAIGPDGAKALAAALEQLTALQALDLRWRKRRGQTDWAYAPPWAEAGREAG